MTDIDAIRKKHEQIKAFYRSCPIIPGGELVYAISDVDALFRELDEARELLRERQDERIIFGTEPGKPLKGGGEDE